MAPDARIVSLKVGAADGAVDVSQMIAAIDWVVQHAHDPGLNIRVINLSYGTNSLQAPMIDPLAYAAEQAWKNGIVVVAAGGNYWLPVAAERSRARRPGVRLVRYSRSAASTRWAPSKPSDDQVPSFSPWPKRGATRGVDLVAAGCAPPGVARPEQLHRCQPS